MKGILSRKWGGYSHVGITAGVPRGRAVMLHHLHQALGSEFPDEALTWAEREVAGPSATLFLERFIRVSRAAPGWRKVSRRRGFKLRIVAARGRAGWQVPPYGEVGGKVRARTWKRLGPPWSRCWVLEAARGSQGDWVGG